MDASSPLSEHTEMYLVTIARIKEVNPSGPVPLSHLAGELDVLPVSANQMVRSLEESGLVSYIPYKGVELTESGQGAALRILRRRRLWEVFLVEKLAFTPEEAGALACRLEHSLPPEAAERLAAFLGHPVQNPLGKIIPETDCEIQFPDQVPLGSIQIDQPGVVSRLGLDPAARSFLAEQGLLTGTRLRILARSNSGDLLVEIEGGKTISLSASLTREVHVQVENPER
jgi:DtxR family Mn-dependent transcriptional regulator